MFEVSKSPIHLWKQKKWTNDHCSDNVGFDNLEISMFKFVWGIGY